MDNSIKLPEEYSNSGELDINNYDLEGDDLNLQTIDSVLNLEDSDLYKMVGEESINVSESNKGIYNSKVKPTNIPQTIVKNEDEQVQDIPSKEIIKNDVVNVENQNVNTVEQNQDIADLDKKISNLNQILDNLIKENNIENIDNIINENKTNINNDSISNNNVISDIKNIINEINTLETKKNEYYSSKNNYSRATNSVNNLLKENNLLQDSGKVVLDNFTPNLKTETIEENFDYNELPTTQKQQATERAIQTERAMGGDPLVEVVPGIGEVVIDSSTQKNANDAIRQHGGLSEALYDSTSNQNNYFESLESKEYTPNFNTESNSIIQNEGFTNTKNENITENFPEPNKDMLKNSTDSIIVLNKISQQLDNIGKSINKSFGALGNSIKDIKADQKNYFYNSTNNNTSSSNSTVNNNRQGDSANNIPEIRGDTPLRDDFPENFKMDSLFSNLRP